jgi:hypothetical protein
MDVPDIAVIVSASATPEIPAAKRHKPAAPGRADFCDRIRAATGWFNTMASGVWNNVTTEKSRRTLFVLKTPDGGDLWCCPGKVFNARLSEEELRMPLPYDTNDENTQLHVSLGLRPSGPNPHWTDYDRDIDQVAKAFGALRAQAIDDAFVPLLADKPEKMAGIPDSRLKRFGKDKKAIAAALESQWGGTGMNGDGDIARFKRTCYQTTPAQLSSADVMSKWLTVVDERGDRINYVDTPQSIRTGDTVLVWYRVLAQACAGNFHVSLEPRQLMRLGRGADGMAKGSAGLAAALAAAMERDDEV